MTTCACGRPLRYLAGGEYEGDWRHDDVPGTADAFARWCSTDPLVKARPAVIARIPRGWVDAPDVRP